MRAWSFPSYDRTLEDLFARSVQKKPVVRTAVPSACDEGTRSYVTLPGFHLEIFFGDESVFDVVGADQKLGKVRIGNNDEPCTYLMDSSIECSVWTLMLK